MHRSHRTIITSAALAAVLTVTPVLSPLTAYAASQETQSQISAAEQQIKDATASYDSAQKKLDDLQQQIDDNQKNIDQLESQLPEQRQKAKAAIRDKYKYQKNSSSLLGAVLNTQNLSDFITTCVYMDQITTSNNEAIEKLNDMEAKLEQNKTELEQAKSQVESEQKNASDALAKAQKARSDAQAKAEKENAEELAKIEADKAAATAKVSGEGVSGTNTESTATDKNATINTSPTTPSAPATSTKDAFIAQWTSRINNYLAGSPMAGTGAAFAEAAWNTGVDPRWSPAIAAIESTKGLYVPYGNSHNAWGWTSGSGGFRRFGSWSEGIYAHVSYLGSTYGASLTPSAAKKYCPPTWQDWYNKVAAQMNRI